jgi:hypothetical protein
MKLKAILLACVVAGFSASFALADGGHHGRHHEHHSATTTTNASGCTQVELRGTFASVSASSFTLTVTKAEAGDEDNNDDNDDDDNNAPSPNLVGQTLTIAVDANTEVSFKTVGALTGPAVGDSAKVEANMCGTPATFTATSVKAQGKALGTAQNLKSKHH